MSNGYPPAGSQNAGQGNVPWGGPFPALHMWPLHDTFQMKMIHLPQGEKVSCSSWIQGMISADITRSAD